MIRVFSEWSHLWKYDRWLCRDGPKYVELSQHKLPFTCYSYEVLELFRQVFKLLISNSLHFITDVTAAVLLFLLTVLMLLLELL